MMRVMANLNEEIGTSNRQLASQSKLDERVERLMSAPGIGVMTATSFVASVDRVERFESAHQLESYLGLVPREWSSAEKQQRGAITKQGNGRMRWLLVEAAWSILQNDDTDGAPLRTWAERIVARRGKRVAVVALARRLAGILYAMWRDGKEYEARLVAANGCRAA